MKQFHRNRSGFTGFLNQRHILSNVLVIFAVLSCVLGVGSFLAACSSVPEETQEPTVTTEATLHAEPVSTAPTTKPIIETASPVTIPPTTDPTATEEEPTQPSTEFSIENSPAYQKLLTLPNAEDFLCNEFGYNVLAIYAEWIDSQEGLMETYPERWYLRKFAEGGAGFFCHTPLAEDNSCDYMVMYMYDFHSLYSSPYTGRRYFTDIPREEISELVYSAYDPIGVDDEIKELFIDYALISEYFAWNVLDPEFRTEWYYEIGTIRPYPEMEPDLVYEELRLTINVWRSGMAEDAYIKCWLVYDEDLNQVRFGTDSSEHLLSGIISN